MFTLISSLAIAADPCTVLDTTPVNLPTGPGKVHHIGHLAKKDVKPGWDAPRFGEDPMCTTQTWLLETVAGLRPILQVCNDGYGASGVGEDFVEIEGNHFSHQQIGGSSWRWSNTTTVQLDPPVLLQSSSSSSWMVFIESETAWDLARHRGTWSESFHFCTEIDDERTEIGGALIPKFDTVKWNWKDTALGSCALGVDSKTGPLSHGAPGAPSDARMSVVVIGNALHVEVQDDSWQPEAKSWIHADHLEIWATTAETMSQECVKERTAMQWGVMTDGTVHRAHGKPGPIQAQVHRVGDTTRWKIDGLDWDQITGLSVVYSDSDDGKKQERLIGTTAVKFGKGETLGRMAIPPETRCVVTDGRLQMKSTASFSREKPLITGP